MNIQTGQIIQGDALEVLCTLPDESVHCVVTSPPYWGLRDYGEDGQGGLEETPEAHIAWIVGVMREVRRVLRKDGTCWLNYGDFYAAGTGAVRPDGKRGISVSTQAAQDAVPRNGSPFSLKAKDLVMMPARVALALQADGWWIRSDIIWEKPNPMPESVTDRPTNSHEHVFLLTKSARYFYDADAVRESCQSGPSDIAKMEQGLDRIGGKHKTLVDPFSKASAATNIGQKRSVGDPSGRNLRNVWTIATQPYKGAHFATFPEKLVEPCIKAGTSEKGCCAVCGTPWKRVVERDSPGSYKAKGAMIAGSGGEAILRNLPHDYQQPQTLGWLPSCLCGQETGTEPGPCIVLDPFAGSGTTGVAAYRLGREFIGIDLAGGDKDLGGHTAHDRLEAARRGKDLGEVAGVVNGKRWTQETLL